MKISQHNTNEERKAHKVSGLNLLSKNHKMNTSRQQQTQQNTARQQSYQSYKSSKTNGHSTDRSHISQKKASSSNYIVGGATVCNYPSLNTVSVKSIKQTHS